jgi:hypothetical protein
MRTTRQVPCLRCDGRGERYGDDNDVVVCTSCMGLRVVSEQLPQDEWMDEDPEDGWNRAQPVRLNDVD